MKKRGRPRGILKSKASKTYQLKSATIDETVRFFERNAGPRIRAARGWLGWSQKDLVYYAGVSLSTLCRMEAKVFEKFRGEIRSMVRVIAALEDNGAMFIDLDPEGDILGGVQFRAAPADTISRFLRRTEGRASTLTVSTKAGDSEGEGVRHS